MRGELCAKMPTDYLPRAKNGGLYYSRCSALVVRGASARYLVIKMSTERKLRPERVTKAAEGFNFPSPFPDGFFESTSNFVFRFLSLSAFAVRFLALISSSGLFSRASIPSQIPKVLFIYSHRRGAKVLRSDGGARADGVNGMHISICE